MKKISIKTQKKLLFIPLVNTFILFIWLFINSRYVSGNWRTRTFVYMFFGMICSSPFIMVCLTLSDKFIEYRDIFEMVACYLSVIIISVFTLSCEKKFGID